MTFLEFTSAEHAGDGECAEIVNVRADCIAAVIEQETQFEGEAVPVWTARLVLIGGQVLEVMDCDDTDDEGRPTRHVAADWIEALSGA